MAENNPSDTPNFIELAGDITIAWLQNPNVHPGSEDVPAFLQKIHAAIAGLDAAPVAEPVEVTYEPAVSVRSSVKPDHLVSLIDGKKYKTLRRHLAGHGLTPDEYRARYGLKADYPMVAESYATQRRDIAKNLGLGRKRSVPAGAGAAVEESPVASGPDAIATQKTAPAKAPAKPKRALSKPKNEGSVAAPDAPEVPDAVFGVPVAPAGQAKAKRAARPARKAVAVAVPEVEASAAVPAVPVTPKPRRMARAPQVAADVVSDAPQGQPEAAEAASKPKRAAAPKKATDKPKPAPEGKSADAPLQKPRGKKAAAVGVEAVSLES